MELGLILIIGGIISSIVVAILMICVLRIREGKGDAGGDFERGGDIGGGGGIRRERINR